MRKFIIKFFALIWRLRIFNPFMQFIGIDYTKFTKYILKLENDYVIDKSYLVKRKIKNIIFLLDLTKPTQRTIYFAYRYENKILKLMMKNIKEGDIFFDIYLVLK